MTLIELQQNSKNQNEHLECAKHHAIAPQGINHTTPFPLIRNCENWDTFLKVKKIIPDMT